MEKVKSSYYFLDLFLLLSASPWQNQKPNELIKTFKG